MLCMVNGKLLGFWVLGLTNYITTLFFSCLRCRQKLEGFRFLFFGKAMSGLREKREIDFPYLRGSEQKLLLYQ